MPSRNRLDRVTLKEDRRVLNYSWFSISLGGVSACMNRLTRQGTGVIEILHTIYFKLIAVTGRSRPGGKEIEISSEMLTKPHKMVSRPESKGSACDVQ